MVRAQGQFGWMMSTVVVLNQILMLVYISFGERMTASMKKIQAANVTQNILANLHLILVSVKKLNKFDSFPYSVHIYS